MYEIKLTSGDIWYADSIEPIDGLLSIYHRPDGEQEWLCYERAVIAWRHMDDRELEPYTPQPLPE